MSEHRIIPELIEMFHRYQCKVCHSWVNYNERNGKWWHQRQSDEQ